ncbi:MAG: lecithin retinol acyltransferase family protein [Burkholderiales bacterium]
MAQHFSYPLGAHLVSPRKWYLHHGIYVGGDRVVHYAGFNRLFRRGPVEEISIAEFERGHGVRILDRSASPFDPNAIIDRARSRLGERRYRLLRNNCEHFSEWCIVGEPRSTQVERWLGLPRTFACTVARSARGRLRRLRERFVPPAFGVFGSDPAKAA